MDPAPDVYKTPLGPKESKRQPGSEFPRVIQNSQQTQKYTRVYTDVAQKLKGCAVQAGLIGKVWQKVYNLCKYYYVGIVNGKGWEWVSGN